MEIQLKKGLLDIVVLSALRSGDSYGYKIVQDILPVIEISESTLYPILKRLEGGGCLTTYSSEHNGRLRKYYRITELGIGRVREFLNEQEQIERIYRYIREADEYGDR